MTSTCWSLQSVKLAKYYYIENERITVNKQEKVKVSSGKNRTKNMEKQFSLRIEKNPKLKRQWDNVHPLSNQSNAN